MKLMQKKLLKAVTFIHFFRLRAFFAASAIKSATEPCTNCFVTFSIVVALLYLWILNVTYSSSSLMCRRTGFNMRYN